MQGLITSPILSSTCSTYLLWGKKITPEFSGFKQQSCSHLSWVLWIRNSGTAWLGDSFQVSNAIVVQGWITWGLVRRFSLQVVSGMSLTVGQVRLPHSMAAPEHVDCLYNMWWRPPARATPRHQDEHVWHIYGLSLEVT